MNWMPLMISLGAFWVSGLVVYFLQVTSRLYLTRQVRQRLHQTVTGVAAPVGMELPEPAQRPDLLPSLSHFLHQYTLGKRLQDYLRSAGLRLRASEFLYGSALMGMAAGALVLLLPGSQWMAPLAGLTTCFLPLLLVRGIREKRLLRINNQLRDWLMLTSSCLRAGHSWSGAMEMAARDMDAPLSEELTRLLVETQRGVSWEEGFRRLLVRVPSQDLDLIVTAILTQREIGGNLGEILAKILYTIQERVRLQSEIRILASQGVFSGIVIGILPMAVGSLLLVIEPTYFQPLLESLLGKMLLGGAFLLQVLGGLFIKKLVTIEY